LFMAVFIVVPPVLGMCMKMLLFSNFRYVC